MRESSDFGIIRRTLDELAPGERRTGRLYVGSMASGHPIELPWLALRGRRPGPCLWLNGAVHGNEVNGVLAALDFFRALDGGQVSGCVVVTPVANPVGFDARRKRVPQDELDLDQSYPGRGDGLTSELLAWRLFEEVRGVADVLVNFHTMSPYFESEPYVVYKTFPDRRERETELLAAAAAFAPFVACRMPIEGGAELPGNIAGALDYQAAQAGALAFMVELGGGSCQEPHHIAHGVRGLDALSHRIGLLPSDMAPVTTVRRVTARRHLMCRHGGLFRPHARPGSIVASREPIGIVEDLWGRVVEEVTLATPVALIGVRNDPVVHSGDRVAFAGLEWDQVEV